MVNQYSKESLEIAICDEIYRNAKNSFKEIMVKLFDNDFEKLPKAILNPAAELYLKQLKLLSTHLGKNYIMKCLQEKSTEKIKLFRALKKQNQLEKFFEDDPASYFRLQQLISEKEDKKVFTELEKFFEEQLSVLIKMGVEEEFIKYFFSWLQSGDINYKIWKKLQTWCNQGAELQDFKRIEWPTPAKTDSLFLKVVKLAAQIETDKFMNEQAIIKTLEIVTKRPTISCESNKIIIKGYTVFLHEHIDDIKRLMTAQMYQIEIYASICCGIDCNLTMPGKNFVIVSNKIYVWSNSIIDLSGEGFESNAVKAQNAKNKDENGCNGRNGKPGSSSGNLMFLASDITNPKFLTILLNGGRGEDGENGGDGYIGGDGKGLDWNEFTQILINYKSLYFGYWSTYRDYQPPGQWSNLSDRRSYENEYVYKEFQDNFGRKIYYSFGGINKHWYDPKQYDLYFWVQGAKGESGTKGGLNGVGGEGGYKGTCTIINPNTGASFNVNVIQKMGQNGIDGEVGKMGSTGKDGNDLAMTDSSVAQKTYFGSINEKLKREYFYNDAKGRAYEGDRQYHEKETSYFVGFNSATLQPRTVIAEKVQRQTQRSQMSTAVAKQAIISEKIFENAEKVFEKLNTNLSEINFEVFEVSAAMNDENEEEEEKEAETQCTEEVVILRQADECKIQQFTHDNKKIVAKPFTQNELIQKIKECGRHGTLLRSAQNLFDLFKLEISWPFLESIKFHTLFQKNHFCQSLRNTKFSLFLIAAQQDKIQDGLTCDQIQQFALEVGSRRALKYNFSHVKDDLKSAMNIFLTIKPSINKTPKNEYSKTMNGIKIGPEYLIEEDDWKNIKMFIFNKYNNYFATELELQLLYDFIKAINSIPQLKSAIDLLKNDSVEWCVADKCEGHLDHLASTKKKKNDEHDSSVEISKSKTAEQEKFEELIKIIKNSKKSLKNALIFMAEASEKYQNFALRFGKFPEILQKSDGNKLTYLKNKVTNAFSSVEAKDAEIEAAKYILRLYFASFKLLIFNRHLYNCNELVLIDDGKIIHDKNQIYIDDGDDSKFENFLRRIRQNPLDTGSNYCETQMKNKSANSSAVCYILAYIKNQNFLLYKDDGYQQIATAKIFHSKAASNNQRALWCHEEKVYEIEKDETFIDFIDSQKAVITHFDNIKTKEILIYKGHKALAEFFSTELQENVFQWIENFCATTDNYTPLLKFLYTSFYVDGCHLTLIELQFILSSFSYLHTFCRGNLDFMLLLLISVPQKSMVNVILFVRLCYHQECRLKIDTKIFTGIELIDNIQHKILFSAKISQHKQKMPSNDSLYKIILMLQHASSGSEQLENMNIQMWKEIAEKQTWSEISSKLKQFGPAGYYLGILDSSGRKKEEEKLRKIIESINFVPECFVGLITALFINNEIENTDEFLDKIDGFLRLGNDWKPVSKDGKKSTLITNNLEQNDLMKYIYLKGGNMYDSNFGNQRNIEDLRRLVIGQHDVTDAEKEARKYQINQYCDYLKYIKSGKIPENLPPKIAETCKLMILFDQKLKALNGKTLRLTQKIAVLCSVLSEIPILEQVNTGEGKSFIIAAITVIRCLRDRTNVDIITSSSVLAKRDSEVMEKLYSSFGLTVGHNCSEEIEKRKFAYQCQIVYGDISQFQRDYLMQTFYKKTILGNRVREVVIVDEVDNMLLDNGNNILYLSHNVPGMNLLDSLMIYLQKIIRMPIFNGLKKNMKNLQNEFSSDRIEEKILSDLYGRYTLEDMIDSDMTKDEKLCKEIYENMVKNNIIDPNGYLIEDKWENIEGQLSTGKNKMLLTRIKNSLKIILNRKKEIELPKYLRSFVKLHLKELIENCKNSTFMDVDYDYVIDVDRSDAATTTEAKVTIIDGNTGADLPSSQWNGGLHQFLQLKHGCRLSSLSLKAVFISNVAYLKGYETINGLSGTLGSHHESKTLKDLYGADLIKIPTFVPKQFYENAPKIATTQSEWIKEIYDEICDQIEDGRSLLIICESIAQAKIVQNGILEIYQAEENLTKTIINCFENITMYTRSGGVFEFEEDEHVFDSGQLIIATNLAGRGTDIKLSHDVIKNGGLHVITAFMPKNTRIEEQAFGRAARYGQPGSAQIIAMRQEDDGIQPSIFQLKTFRDNAEIQRLASLKVFYDYHTEIEEQCLEKFRSHCDKVLSAIYSSTSSSTASSSKIQNPQQIIYFALLDKWAMWLDEKTPLIEKCSKNSTVEERESEKEAIINSVEEFLQNHPIEIADPENSWLDFPQSKISLALYYLCNNNYSKAISLLDNVLNDESGFAAEALYLKAAMKLICGENGNAINIKDRELGFEYFHKARVLFQNRIDRKQRDATTVAQMINEGSHRAVNVHGFEEQHKSIMQYLNMIIANIDWIIGTPCNGNIFVHDGITEMASKNIFYSLQLGGIISPSLLYDENLESWQIDMLKRKYKLSKKSIIQMLNKIKSDPRTQRFNGKYVIEPFVLQSHVKLSNRLDFFYELLDRRIICNAQIVVYIESLYVAEIQPIFEKAGIKPISKPKNDDPKLPLNHLISLNGCSKDIEFYNRDEISEKLKEFQMKEIASKLKDDIIGIINFTALKDFTYFTAFDGISVEDLADYFEISKEGALWILQSLEDIESLKRQTVLRCRFTLDDKLWNSKMIPSENEEENYLIKNSIILNQLRNKKDLQNITPKLIEHFCKNPEKKENEKIDIFKKLQDEKLIEYYQKTMYRIFTKLDCSFLPSCIAEEVDEFLADRFAYSFALENLCLSLDTSQNEKNAAEIKIFLPENPYENLFKDLINMGLILPPRISTFNQDEIEEDDFEADEYETIKQLIFDNKSKIYDKTEYHLSMIPLEKYLQDQGESATNSEIKSIMENGMKAVLSKSEKSLGFTLLSEVVGGVTTVVKAIWSGVKAVGNWFYGIGSSAAGWISENIINPVADAVNYVAAKTKKGLKYIKKAVGEVATIIAESEAFKAVASCTKAVASAVGNVVGEVVEGIGKAAYAIGDVTGINAGVKAIANAAISTKESISSAAKKVSQKASELWEEAKEMASDACEYISSTKLFKMAKSAAETVAAVSKGAYKKMSSFCTALTESYEYYNQCRAYSRKIAMESNSGISEHIILRNYMNAKEKQNEIEGSDRIFEDKLRDHLTKHLENSLLDIKNLMNNVFNENFNTDLKISEDLLESFKISGKSVKRFKSLIDEKFMVEATKTKIIFHFLLSTYVNQNAPLGSMKMPDMEISLNKEEYKGMLKILCMELITLAEDDEGFDESDDEEKSFEESDDEEKSFDESDDEEKGFEESDDEEKGFEESDDEEDKLSHKSKEQFTYQLSEALITSIRDSTFQIFVSLPLQCIFGYLTNIRNPSGQLESMASFDKADIELKQALVQYNSSIQEKRDNDFLLKEMIECLHEKCKTKSSLKALQAAIKFGYPLPIESVEEIQKAVEKAMSKNKQWKINIEIHDDLLHHPNVTSSKTFKPSTNSNPELTMHLQHINNCIYVCQTDYMKYENMGDVMGENINNAFLYENLAQNYKFIKAIFPLETVSFRDSLIHYLNID